MKQQKAVVASSTSPHMGETGCSNVCEMVCTEDALDYTATTLHAVKKEFYILGKFEFLLRRLMLLLYTVTMWENKMVILT